MSLLSVPLCVLQTHLPSCVFVVKCLLRCFWRYFLINVTDNDECVHTDSRSAYFAVALKLSLCLKLILLTRDVQRLGGINLTCRLTYRCLPHSSLPVILTHARAHTHRTNLTYMLSLLFKKKNTYEKKEPELNCLTVQFFLLVLGNLSSHSDLLPGMGKRVDARTFSHL